MIGQICKPPNAREERREVLARKKHDRRLRSSKPFCQAKDVACRNAIATSKPAIGAPPRRSSPTSPTRRSRFWWDARAEKSTNHPAANKLLRYDYRAPYRL
jgi:hypothetical protein